MSLSVTEPIHPAIGHTRRVLFSPFNFEKWLCLGFCSLLAMLGQGVGGGTGGNSNFNVGGGPGGGPGGPAPDLQPAIDWIRDNALILAAIVGAALIFMLILTMLLSWLSGRGSFMFLDGVVRNRAAVAEPWREYRREGNSVFVFRFVLALIGMLGMILLLVVCGLIAWQDLKQQEFGGMVNLSAVVGVGGFLGFYLVVGIIRLLLKDFVVPIMYLQRISTMEAWRVFHAEMFPGNLGKLVLYVLMKILIALVAIAASVPLMCVIVLGTCCIAALPVISYVVTLIVFNFLLLPISVFERSYSLYFVAQFGPQWTIIPDLAEPPDPAEPVQPRPE